MSKTGGQAFRKSGLTNERDRQVAQMTKTIAHGQRFTRFIFLGTFKRNDRIFC